MSYLNSIQAEQGWPILNLCHFVQTRWLSLGQSLERILTIWNSLVYYMNQKPPFPGMTDKKYKSFSDLLEDRFFRLEIICLSAITVFSRKSYNRYVGVTKTINSVCHYGLL